MLVNKAALDWIGVDLQHGPISPSESTHLLRAIQAANRSVTPFVRLPDHSRYWIEQSLDAGYLGLIVPMVESASQARDIVRYSHYPPVGTRSYAGSVRASLYDGYPQEVDQRLSIWMQIESSLGLQNAEEIAAVDGVTGLLLGPADLSLSCEWCPQDLWSQPEFIQAAKKVVDLCNAHDLDAAILTGIEGALHAANIGYRCIGFGSDAAWTRIDLSRVINDATESLSESIS